MAEVQTPLGPWGPSPVGSGEQETPDTVFPFDTLTTILVGPQEKPYALHRTVLTDVSDFFAAALDGKFKEGEEGMVRLPDHDVATFNYFLNWLYTQSLSGYFYRQSGTLSMAALRQAAETEVKSSKTGESYTVAQRLAEPGPRERAFFQASYWDLPFTRLIQLYIFADALQIRGLRDRIVSALIRTYGMIDHSDGLLLSNWSTLPFWDTDSPRPSWLPLPAEGLALAFDKLPVGDPLRRVLLLILCDNVQGASSLSPPSSSSSAATSTSTTTIASSSSALPPGVLETAFAMVLERWANSRPPTPWKDKGMICNFHRHDTPCEQPSEERRGCGFTDDRNLESKPVIPDEGLPMPE